MDKIEEWQVFAFLFYLPLPAADNDVCELEPPPAKPCSRFYSLNLFLQMAAPAQNNPNRLMRLVGNLWKRVKVGHDKWQTDAHGD